MSSSSSCQSSPDPEPIDTGKRSYERWSDDEEKMLINLWAENFERINSIQAHFDEIDAVMGCHNIVTLSNVKEDRSAVSEQEESTVKDQGDCVKKKEARTKRKKTKKREREEENDNEDRKMFKAVFEGLETQQKDVNTFVNNFSRIQEEQLTTMTALVGTLAKFLEKQ